MDIHPLQHPDPGEIPFPTPATSRGRAVLSSVETKVQPESKEPHEVALVVLPSCLCERCSLLATPRTLTRILDRKKRSEHHDLAKHPLLDRRHEHATDAWINGQLGKHAPCFGQLVGAIDRPKFMERRPPLFNHPARRAFEEGELIDVSEVMGEHAEDHACKIRSKDLRLGEWFAGIERLL